jgi:hypothetical protein
MKLAGVIYLYDISQTRMLGTTLNNMEMFHELCGDDALKAVFLLTTKWGAVNVEVGEKREKQLSDESWKPMLAQGSTIRRFDHTPASAQATLGLIYTNYNKREVSNILRIQQEIVDMQEWIPDTRAGKKLRYTLQEILDKQKTYRPKDKDSIRKTVRQLEQLKIPFSQRFLGFLGLVVSLS